MAVDLTGRTYTACANNYQGSSCIGYSSCSIVSNGLDNVQLATFGNY